MTPTAVCSSYNGSPYLPNVSSPKPLNGFRLNLVLACTIKVAERNLILVRIGETKTLLYVKLKSSYINFIRNRSLYRKFMHDIKHKVLLTYLLIHSLTQSMVQAIIWKADSHSACQQISCFLYGTRRFITVFTKARHWTLYWASRFQFAPSIHISLRSGRAKKSVQVRGVLKHFATIRIFTVRVCSPTPNPQAGGPLLVGCPRLLIQYIRSYPP
jgi:hypothetical protein